MNWVTEYLSGLIALGGIILIAAVVVVLSFFLLKSISEEVNDICNEERCRE